MNNLGWILQHTGDYTEARKLFEESINIAEQNNIGDIEYIWSLNNLAALLYFQGDYEKARLIFDRAISSLEKNPEAAKDWQKTVHLYRNLGGTLDALGKGTDAIASYKKAIAIVESQNPVDELELAQATDDLAASLEDKGKFDEALSLFERALSIKEKLLGADHADLVQGLNNIGVLYLDTNRSAEAQPLLERALLINKKIMGAEHISSVPIMNNLGDCFFLKNDKKAAFEHYLQAAQTIESYFEKILPNCSVAEQQAAIDQYSMVQISRLLSSAANEQDIERAYSLFFQWKGILVDTLANESKFRRAASASKCAEKLEQLSKLRTQLAAWYQQAGSIELELWEKENRRLSAEKEKLEREVQSATGNLLEIHKMSYQSFSNLLQADEAFVDVYKYGKMEAKEGELLFSPAYAAIITGSSKGDKSTPSLVELGRGDAIELKAKIWRDEVLSLNSAAGAWAQLSSVLRAPFLKIKDANKVFVCPDAELARLPWHLIVPAKIKEQTILSCQIDSARELANLRSASKQNGAATDTLLLVSGVDFNAGADSRSKVNIYLPLLPGTVQEGKEIATLARATGKAVIELSGSAASKKALISFLPQATYAHLATHGYFFDESFVDKMTDLRKSASRAIVLKARAQNRLALRNPLVESGIALSGANKATSSGAPDNNGYFTAEEFLEIDLSHCKIVTLSACDTGRGEEITGQGIMGLRAAIMAAGASNVIMSLWRVPDQATAILMKELYQNMWLKKMKAAEALKTAQVSLSKQNGQAKPAEPVNWAGWVLVGEGW
jgi:CHAT domain-containing protein/tetratricopeptide (TPR) repeat protein